MILIKRWKLLFSEQSYQADYQADSIFPTLSISAMKVLRSNDKYIGKEQLKRMRKISRFLDYHNSFSYFLL